MEDFKDTLVTYKTAQKAKSAGFHAFVPHHFINAKTIVGGWIQGDKKHSKKDIESYLKNPEASLVAPTQGLLHLWIEKKKRLSVSVVFKTEGDRIVGCVPIIANLKTGCIKVLSFTFRSYKRAMEKGLFVALD